VEKIVGALELLKSLQQFAVYIEEISLYIKQLIDLNKELLPEINSMISLIESKIATTESEFSKQNEERNHIQESLNQHKMEIQQRERSCMTGQNERKYELEYPEYRFLKIKDTNLKDAIEESVRKLNDYSRFLKQLKKAQKGIEGISYAIV
jgi:lipopolysaccharide export LptBFGC system permease protein LptF